MNRLEAEFRVLQALASETCDPALREKITRDLADYSWNTPEHAILFCELADGLRNDLHNRERHLLATLTRAGFPESDISDLFLPVSVGRSEIQEILRELVNPGG